MHDTLKLHKDQVEGELYRVIEIPVMKDDHLPKHEADRLFAYGLPENYGIAGEMFMQYVVPNKQNVINRMHELQAEFDVAAGLRSKERFYSSCFAAAFTGAEIANQLGIIDIPIEPVKKWAIQLLKDIRKAVYKGSFSNNGKDYNRIISKYWNEIIGQVLADNAPMLAFVRHLGFSVHRMPEEPDVVEAKLVLEEGATPPTPPAASPASAH